MNILITSTNAQLDGHRVWTGRTDAGQDCLVLVARVVGLEADDVDERALDAVRRLEARYGRLVPLPALRAELADVAAAKLTRTLLSLEVSRRLYLRVANDPAGIHPGDRKAAIEVPGRGWLFYAALPEERQIHTVPASTEGVPHQARNRAHAPRRDDLPTAKGGGRKSR